MGIRRAVNCAKGIKKGTLKKAREKSFMEGRNISMSLMTVCHGITVHAFTTGRNWSLDWAPGISKTKTSSTWLKATLTNERSWNEISDRRENHGGKLRIWFVYKGVRVRETWGFLTQQKTGALQVSYAPCLLRNKNWCFRLCKTVSLLTNLEKFGETRQDLTIKELAENFWHWKKLKSQKHHSTHTVPHQKYPEHNRWKKSCLID